MKWLNTLSIAPDFNISLVNDYLRPLLVITPHFLVGLIEGDGSIVYGILANYDLVFPLLQMWKN